MPTALVEVDARRACHAGVAQQLLTKLNRSRHTCAGPQEVLNASVQVEGALCRAQLREAALRQRLQQCGAVALVALHPLAQLGSAFEGGLARRALAECGSVDEPGDARGCRTEAREASEYVRVSATECARAHARASAGAGRHTHILHCRAPTAARSAFGTSILAERGRWGRGRGATSARRRHARAQAAATHAPPTSGLCDAPPQPPSRHAIQLGERVDDDRTVAELAR